ncbi:MAG: hypothetical protein AAFN77_09990, partial [Planctomycetota bacterium]
MKTIRPPSQQQLFDSFDGVIGKAGRKKIAEGWQSIFREIILEQMPVEKVSRNLSDDSGRPSFELFAIVGLLMIRDFQGWTVPETHEAQTFSENLKHVSAVQAKSL